MANNKIKDTKEDRSLNFVITMLLIFIAVAAAYPLYLVVIASISDPSYISEGKIFLLPKGINFEAYKILFQTKEIWIGYRNSIFYTVVGTALQMLVTTPAAFALSRKSLPGRKALNIFFIFTMYFSGGLIPTYLVVKECGLTNTVWSLIIPVLMGPYNLIIARNYFENSIPEDIYESACMDGAGMFRYFVQFALPLAKPVLAVMVLNFALGHWNSYLNAQIYISNDNIQTLQVIIRRITMQAASGLESSGPISSADVVAQIRQTQLLKYAVVVVSSIPMIILYPFIQKNFVKGIMIGSVKG